jgi:hypothetical protein
MSASPSARSCAAGETTLRDRSLERGRLLAGGEEQRREQEQAPHA